MKILSTDNLDDAQLAAVTSTAPRILVSSCAGSGKSRTIIARIKWLVEQGVAPRSIIAISFTVAAGKVLTERLGFKIGFSGNLHSFLFRLLNQHAGLAGHSPGIGVIDADGSEAMLSRIRGEHRFRGTDAQVEAALKEWPSALANPTPAQLVVAAYRRMLRLNNSVDFDMILQRGKHVIEKLVANSQWHYKALCVDEVQDASEMHAAIYDAMPCTYRMSCGDSAQSIFSFLGGSISSIEREAAMGAKVYRLETSYRCASEICKVATHLMESSGERTLPRPGAPCGYVAVTEHEDFNAEVTAIAQNIRALKAETSAAVLLRTNALCEQYREALRGFGIPIAAKEKATQPRDWPLVRSLVAALQDPANEFLAMAFLSALKDKNFSEQQRRLAVAAQNSLNEHCLHLPYDLNAADAVAFVSMKQPSTESMDKLRAALSLLEPDASIGDFVVALADPPKQEATANGVTVTTFHSAKGQEYDSVWLAAFEETIIPSGRQGTDVSEERRCVYVGMTRARQNLFITHCRTRQQPWGRREIVEMQPSRFIAECGLKA